MTYTFPMAPCGVCRWTRTAKRYVDKDGQPSLDGKYWYAYCIHHRIRGPIVPSN